MSDYTQCGVQSNCTPNHNLPIPDGPITVGIDGGYVRDWEAKKHNFEVIVGKSTLAFTRDEDEETPSSKRFGSVANFAQGAMKGQLDLSV